MLTANTKQYIIESLRSEIASHNLKSGEIIICHDIFDEPDSTVKNTIEIFLARNGIKTHPHEFGVSKIDSDRAIASMKYGLSTKPNYTHIDIEFTNQDQNRIVHTFLQLFNAPNFYVINSKLFKSNLDLYDFWESGGAIVIDKMSIGILWTNDLYDQFNRT